MKNFNEIVVRTFMITLLIHGYPVFWRSHFAEVYHYFFCEVSYIFGVFCIIIDYFIIYGIKCG